MKIIDAFSSILHPYFDGSESYPENFKYSLKDKYISVPDGMLNQHWDGFCISVNKKNTTVIECNNLNEDISYYEKFRIFALIPESVQLKLYCNGILELEKKGGINGYYESDKNTINKEVKSLKYEFYNNSEKDVEVKLYYIGLFKSGKCPNYIDNIWEGCFEKDPDTKLFNEHYISEENIKIFKEKIKEEPYKSIYSNMKKAAEKTMKFEPEKYIGRTTREHHIGSYKIDGTINLAMVGQIEQNYDMLKMACRHALSIACFEYWCADPMETAQGITWHHRSFDEAHFSSVISTVLSYAGGLLTWHGRNLLYNAIIMKGLPRIEADLMTMEYIYSCNQCIYFLIDYIPALITLSDVYPRYKTRIEEAKKLLNETIHKAIESNEGAVYWRTIVLGYFGCISHLARYENKKISDYCDDKIISTSDFALSLLDENANLLSMNDSHYNQIYTAFFASVFYELTNDLRWAAVYHRYKLNGINEIIRDFEFEVPKTNVPFLDECVYIKKEDYVRLYRNGILFAFISGPSNDTHAHCDKGSFIIHKNGKIIVPDCCDNYDLPMAHSLYNSKSHSLTLPIIKNEYIEQNRGKNYQSIIEKMNYENGILEIVCDNSKIWKSDNIKLNKRTVISQVSNEFIIIDEFEFVNPAQLEFRLNVTNKENVKVETLNWTPVSREYVELYSNGCVHSNQICLRSNEDKNFKIKTKILIL